MARIPDFWIVAGFHEPILRCTGFQIGRANEPTRRADLEIGDTVPKGFGIFDRLGGLRYEEACCCLRHAALFHAPGSAAIGRSVEAALQWQGLYWMDRPRARRCFR